jgi:hypothetical protein
MAQSRRKPTKAATRNKTPTAKSPRQLRDLDERDPSKVKGGLSYATTSTPTAGIDFTRKTSIPCV